MSIRNSHDGARESTEKDNQGWRPAINQRFFRGVSRLPYCATTTGQYLKGGLASSAILKLFFVFSVSPW